MTWDVSGSTFTYGKSANNGTIDVILPPACPRDIELTKQEILDQINIAKAQGLNALASVMEELSIYYKCWPKELVIGHDDSSRHSWND